MWQTNGAETSRQAVLKQSTSMGLHYVVWMWLSGEFRPGPRHDGGRIFTGPVGEFKQPTLPT